MVVIANVFHNLSKSDAEGMLSNIIIEWAKIIASCIVTVSSHLCMELKHWRFKLRRANMHY